MKKNTSLALIAVFILSVWGCESAPPVDPVNPNVVISGVVFCKHKYTDSYSFAYYGQLRKYQDELFGQTIWVYEYTLANGLQHYLTGDEVSNYVCTPQ